MRRMVASIRRTCCKSVGVYSVYASSGPAKISSWNAGSLWASSTNPEGKTCKDSRPAMRGKFHDRVRRAEPLQKQHLRVVYPLSWACWRTWACRSPSTGIAVPRKDRADDARSATSHSRTPTGSGGPRPA